MALRLLLTAIFAIGVASVLPVPDVFALEHPLPPPPPPPPPPQQFQLAACWSGIACISFSQLALNITDFLFAASVFVVLAIFVVGAASVVLGGVHEQRLSQGRRMMRDSLIGLAIIVGSYAIYRTVIFILYAGP